VYSLGRRAAPTTRISLQGWLIGAASLEKQSTSFVEAQKSGMKTYFRPRKVLWT
jgi:hypothetical protein